MAEEIRSAFPEAQISFIESSGGVFEVSVDGRLVFSKRQLGRHAEPGEVTRLLRSG